MNFESPEERLAYEVANYYHRMQTRKYTGEPYVTHCVAVSEIVKSVPHNILMPIAAMLHDTLEDTDINRVVIQMMFGQSVYYLVWALTHVDAAHLPRQERKALDRDKLSNASADAQTIKLADMINNTATIVPCDPKFSKVYLPEMRMLLGALNKGNRQLWNDMDEKLKSLCY